MKIAKRMLLILMSTMLLIGGSGCGMNNTKNETAQKKEPALNEWQKEFLAEQNLPTEYSELNLTQQLSVDAIYEMIMYLEDKYGVKFEYTGYVRPQILEDEYMTAIPKGGNEKTDTVTVTRQDDGTLTDDYPNVAVRPYYEQMITDYIKDYFGSDKVRVFSTVTETTIKDSYNINKDSFKNNIYGVNCIFIENSICTLEKFKDFINDYSEWSKEYGYASTNRIMLFFNGDISKLTHSNFTDYYGKEHLVARYMCYVEKNGEIQINEREVR